MRCPCVVHRGPPQPQPLALHTAAPRLLACGRHTTSERETKNIKDTMSQAIGAVTGDTDAKEPTPDAPAQAQAALVPADSDDGRWKPPLGQGGAKE